MDHLQCWLLQFYILKIFRFLFEGITWRFGLSMFCRDHCDPKMSKKICQNHRNCCNINSYLHTCSTCLPAYRCELTPRSLENIFSYLISKWNIGAAVINSWRHFQSFSGQVIGKYLSRKKLFFWQLIDFWIFWPSSKSC